MANVFKLIPVDLKLFEGAPLVASPSTGDGNGDGASGGSEQKPLDTRKGKKAGAKETVVYGKQPDGGSNSSDAGNESGQTQTRVTSDTLEDRKRRYNEAINGEFKDLDTERTQELFNRRFKEVKAIEEANASQKPIIEMLLQKYGVNDVSALEKAINEDDSFFEAAAEEAGMTVQQYKEFQRLQRENSMLKDQQDRELQQQQAQTQVQKWVEDAEALKALPGYESFDLQEEIKNPRFLGLLKSHIPVKDAYDVLHLNDIKQNVAAQTAEQTQKYVTDNIRARGSRPAENGVTSQSSIIVKNDVSKLTRQDRDEIARRVARGEKIVF